MHLLPPSYDDHFPPSIQHTLCNGHVSDAAANLTYLIRIASVPFRTTCTVHCWSVVCNVSKPGSSGTGIQDCSLFHKHCQSFHNSHHLADYQPFQWTRILPQSCQCQTHRCDLHPLMHIPVQTAIITIITITRSYAIADGPFQVAGQTKFSQLVHNSMKIPFEKACSGFQWARPSRLFKVRTVYGNSNNFQYARRFSIKSFAIYSTKHTKLPIILHHSETLLPLLQRTWLM